MSVVLDWLTAVPAPELGGLSLIGNPWLDVLLILVVGVIAGTINALAGGGTFLVLPMLIALGLPANTANGTIRVAVLAQTSVATATFHSEGVREYATTRKLILPVLVGTAIGSFFATRLDNAMFRPVIGVALLIWAVILLVKPDRFLHPPDEAKDPNGWTYFFAGLIGLYGGFLQAGVGFPILALLSGQLGYDLVRSNSIKVSMICVYTLIALPMFAFAGQVAWVPAAVLASGTMLGAWLGARWQIEKGSEMVRWAVLVMVAVGGVLMLRPLVLDWIG